MANSKWQVCRYWWGCIAWRRPDPHTEYWHYYVMDIINWQEFALARDAWLDWEWATTEEFRKYPCDPIEKWR